MSLVFFSLLVAVLAFAQGGDAVLGLDHVPVAVRDLEQATATYQRLGFSLKPGRPHANGIRNMHVKCPDGSGIELLTAPKGVDDLSAHYVNFLETAEGPAFVSFHDRDTARLHAALRRGGYEITENAGITETRIPELGWLFMVRDNRSPTDRPEHFAHPNGATAMRTIWLAPDDGEVVSRLLVSLGGRAQRRRVGTPTDVEATVVRLAAGDVVIAPRSQQIRTGRPIIGASFTVRDLAHVRDLLARAGIKPWSGDARADRVVVEPSVAHGLWLEFAEGGRRSP